MLAAGKITSEDAERLLDKLAATDAPDQPAGTDGKGNNRPAKDGPTTAKFLRVLVDKGDGHDVNVRVPIAFLRSGVKLLGVLPPKVAQKLNDKGFNLDILSGLKGNELDEALNALHVDIDTDDGHHVKVFCE